MISIPRTRDFPVPPPNKRGWPWNEAAFANQAPPNNNNYPLITVVTPSYNQGQYLEQTIRSVLLQNYPALEYIIIDGHSTDESVQIIKRYTKYLAYWVSESDRGQSHAINKGFTKSNGEIICWLNSDDYFLPGTLHIVAENLKSGTGNFALVGHCLVVDPDGHSKVLLKGKYESRKRLLKFWEGYHMHQPAIFWRREVMEKVGLLDEEQHFIMDFDYWARIAKHFDFKNIDHILACATYHEAAKTGDSYKKYHEELRKNASRYWGSIYDPHYWMLRFSMFKHLTYLPFRGRAKNSMFYRAGRVKEAIKSLNQ